MGRTDKLISMPLEAVGSVLGGTWTFTDHFARRNTGGWNQMSLRLIRVSASMKYK